MNVLFFGSLLLYFIAMVLQFAAAVFKKEKLGQGAWLLFLAAFVLAGLSFRFGWLMLPFPARLAADVSPTTSQNIRKMR